MAARWSRTGCGPWVLAQWVRRPSSSHRDAAARTSSGQGARRWLTRRARTTTSHLDQSRAPVGRYLGAEVCPYRRVEQDLVAEGRLGVDDDGERVVVDVDQFGRVGTLVVGVGDDGGDGLTDVADHAGGQPRSMHGVEQQAGHIEGVVVEVDVVGGEDGHDAGAGLGR